MARLRTSFYSTKLGHFSQIPLNTTLLNRMANEAMQGGEIGVGKEVGSHSQSPSETTPIINNATEQMLAEIMQHFASKRASDPALQEAYEKCPQLLKQDEERARELVMERLATRLGQIRVDNNLKTYKCKAPQPPRFNPKSKSINVEEWLHACEVYYDGGEPTTDSQRIKLSILNSENVLKAWEQHKLTIITSGAVASTADIKWSDFKIWMIKVYGDPHSADKARRTLAKWKQRASVQEFVRDMNQFRAEVGDDPSSKVGDTEFFNYVKNGLKVEIRQFMPLLNTRGQAWTGADFDEYIRAAMELEHRQEQNAKDYPKDENPRGDKAGQARKRKFNDNFKTGAPKTNGDSKVAGNNPPPKYKGKKPLTLEEKKALDGKCYNCHKEGHVSRDCPKKAKSEN